MMIDNKYKVLNRDVIKYIAMATMLLYHVIVIFFKNDSWQCTLIEGICNFTAITMVYFLVEGFGYTHSKKDYIRRLFIFAVISQIPFCLARTQHGIISFNYDLNFLFSLCLCFLILLAFDKIKNKALLALVAIASIGVSFICDWPFLVEIFTLLFIWAKGSPKRLNIAFLLSFVACAAFSFIISGNSDIAARAAASLLNAVGLLISWFCIVCLYNGKRMEKGRTFSKWFFYIFYPGHLLILGLLRILILK